MTDFQFAELVQQLTQLWEAMVVFAFLQLTFMLGVVFASVWSVRSVNKRHQVTEDKWNELLALLIHNARHMRDA